ncbi:MAG: FAD-dependent oxidoreductase, partial [Deltaproteobacteria bacterium]|nr:FAD-dependent oxidoreductase [Deltaproteobacteria bacterium]
VIGGGSVAVDAARLSLRLGAEQVNLVCLESTGLVCKDRMPAQDLEIGQAGEEGVTILPSLGVSNIITEEGRITGLQTVNCVSVIDPEGRFAPQFSEDPAPVILADTVIVAIGQRPDDKDFAEVDKTPFGTVKADKSTMETNIRGVFAGGDVVSGPADVIGAVAAGKEAAISIALFLADMDLKESRPAPLQRIEEVPKEGVEKEAREAMPLLEPDKREAASEVELGFQEETAMRESQRCLHCGVYAQKESSEVARTRGVGI